MPSPDRFGFKNRTFILPDNEGIPNCDDSAIWTNLTTKELHICLDGDKLVFHSGMSQIGPNADPDIISWVADTLTVNGNFIATNVGSIENYVSSLYATTANATTANVNTAYVDTANITTINNTTLNVSSINTTDFGGYEKSSDPTDPVEGHYKIWMSDGTGSGDDGDIMIKIKAGDVIKTKTLIDFSA